MAAMVAALTAAPGASRLQQRRRHALHRQASSVQELVQGRLRHDGHDHGARSSTFLQRRMLAPICRCACSSARCCTPTTRTSSRTSASPAGSARRICQATPPSAASAARRAWRHREHHRGDRAEARHRCAGSAATQLLTASSDRKSPTPYGRSCEQHAAAVVRASCAVDCDYDTRRRARSQLSTRHRRRICAAVDDAVKFGISLHEADAQPGQRAGQHLHRRHGAWSAPAAPRWARA